MKKAVMYGAGNIGRGFIGQLFYESGYETVFIDVNSDVVQKINSDKSYPVKFVSDRGSHEQTVKNISAVDGRNEQAVVDVIAQADIMATAVGVNILPYIAKPLALGLKKRWSSGIQGPLNIIICENLINADIYLKKLISEQLDDAYIKKLDENIGFVEASIGRMVPVMTPDMQGDNILRICVEEYSQLPVDKDGFKGSIPEIKNLNPFSPFSFYIQRKLFIHNMGHAASAYLGALKSYTYIWQAVEDEQIIKTVKEAMTSSAKALSKEHNVELKELLEHVDDLLSRFGNRQLGDTVARVGRDLTRKLLPEDRLTGALNLCIKHKLNTDAICTAIAAALCFEDPAESRAAGILKSDGPEKVLKDICQIKPGTDSWKTITQKYKELSLPSSPFVQ